MVLHKIALALLLAGAPQFEVSDVHPSAPATNPDTFVSGGLLATGRYDLRRATLLDLIAVAWEVKPALVFGGPSWIALDRYDLSAKAPPATQPQTANLMLQSLLADRFKLMLHNDTRPLPVYTLSRSAAEPKLRHSDGTGNPTCQAQPQTTEYSCHNMTMAIFAGTIRRISGGAIKDPVTNETGIEGAWDFDLKLDSRTTISEAIEKQLGLKLELRQIPTPVIVVDSANEKPTANAPGISKLLPPRSLEFEVAAIKVSPEGERFGFRRYQGGRLELHAFPMKMLIATAWDVDWDHMDERIAAPKWIDTKRFDVIANTSSPSVIPQGTGVFDEDFQQMLRALLVDRFGIKTHFEDRPVPAYTLTALKPKLTKADPNNRAHCGITGTVIGCQNVTMAQFAQQLSSMDRVEAAFNDVADRTRLSGAYDFTIAFSPKALLKAEGDPNGAISLFEAIRQQLGLKLELQKRPLPVLVVDRIEETPAEN